MFKYTFGSKTTSLDSHRSQKSPLTARFRQTSYNDFVSARSEFLRITVAPNESLRLIIRYYMFVCSFWIKTNLLESLRYGKTPLKARFRYKLLKGLSFYANLLFRLVWAPNESLRLIITQYIFKYSFRIKTTLLESHRSQESPLKARFT